MRSPKELNNLLLPRFISLIAQYTGLQVREQDWLALSQKIKTRCQLLKLPELEAYYQLLSANTDASHSEWQELAILLTNGESYFFRDRGQMSLLRNRLLPELIERQQQERSLTLWSAGCSTGEEPYSLAIMLTELIPNWPDWDLLILGTDINRIFLNRAQLGLYSSWSFRLVPSDVKNRYFFPIKHNWKLDDRLRRLVTFRYGNLTDNNRDNLRIDSRRFDLILCRNVFVYFDAPAISKALQNFCSVLKPGGYLMTGHAELTSQRCSPLRSLVFPESVVYQHRPHLLTFPPQAAVRGTSFLFNNEPVNRPNKNRKISGIIDRPLPPKKGDKIEANSLYFQPKKSVDDLKTNLRLTALFKQAEFFFHNKSYPEAIQKASQLLELHPRHFEAYYLIARVYANLGQLTQAAHYSQLALAVNSLSIPPHYLLATIAEEKGDIDVAKLFLKKIIYLDPAAVCAYLELGLLYAKESNLNKAKKQWAIALELLDKMPEYTLIESPTSLTAKELMGRVKKLLSTLP